MLVSLMLLLSKLVARVVNFDVVVGDNVPFSGVYY